MLACDSIASIVGYYVPALGDHVEESEEGNFVARFNYSQVVTQVTNSYGGVTKMFPLHEGEARWLLSRPDWPSQAMPDCPGPKWTWVVLDRTSSRRSRASDSPLIFYTATTVASTSPRYALT